LPLRSGLIMSFTWGEVSKWAKSHGYKISRKDGLFLWHNVENTDICGEESSLGKLVTAVFNQITDHKWVEYQVNYEKNN
jgi:hypothetical protein